MIIKHILLTSLSLAITVFSFAQSDLKSKKGTPILPEAGEFSIGISANPFLQYIGNVANTGFNPAATYQYPSSPFFFNTIAFSGKYMISNTQAYRVRINLASKTRRDRLRVANDTLMPSLTDINYGEDLQKTQNTFISIGAGKEWRRGKGRVQGVFGAEALIELGGIRRRYEYNNQMEQNFTSPTSSNFGGNLLGAGNSSSSRVLETRSGKYFGGGVRGFVGVEFFVGPKLSLGGEFGYSIRYLHQGKSEFTYETFDVASTTRIEKTEKGNSHFNDFSLGLDNITGLISLNFYF